MNPITDDTLLIKTTGETVLACDFSLLLTDTLLAALVFGVKDLAQIIVLVLICTATFLHWNALTVTQNKSNITDTAFNTGSTLASCRLGEAIAGLGTSSTTHIIVTVSFAGCSCKESMKAILITYSTW